MKEEVSDKESVSQKVFLGIGAVTVVAVIAIMVYFFRASDPAARGPVPYKKFDYGKHMEEQMNRPDRTPPSASGTASSSR